MFQVRLRMAKRLYRGTAARAGITAGRTFSGLRRRGVWFFAFTQMVSGNAVLLAVPPKKKCITVMRWFKGAGVARGQIDTCQAERSGMVETQLKARGVADPRVLAVMRDTPRHLFLPPERRQEAYRDRAVPIACGQTISQPYMVAVMTEMLQLPPCARVLEIGTGSGYQTAVLAQLAERVISVERHPDLTREARLLLEGLGYDNITFITADGSTGFAKQAPYDGILVTAGAPRVPDRLLKQLAEGGRLVAPVGNEQLQRLVVVTRQGNAYQQETGISCRFVPLVGEQGWQEK